MASKPSLDYCLKLLKGGFSIMTVGENKEPWAKWKHLQTKQIAPEEFETQYTDSRTKGVGIVTGFDNLEVIDVDLKVLKNDKERTEFWNEYLKLLNDNIFEFEKKFVIVRTVNNGFHILYKSELARSNTKIARIEKVGANHPCLIESRGVGGYVWSYSDFIQGSSYFDVKKVENEDVEILWQISRLYDVPSIEPEIIPKKIVTELNFSGLTCWEDFNRKNSVWDIIQNDFTIVGKTRLGILVKRLGAKSAHSGTIFENSGFLYLHSTATIYPAEKLITPFTAYTIKNYNGDFSAAAKQAYKDGYGDRIKKPAPTCFEKKAEPEDYDFPIDILPEKLREYFFELNAKLNSSIDYMGTSLLWVVSMCLGNTVKVKVKNGWIEPAIIWAAIVGKAGVGKTHNIDNIIKPLQRINEREVHKFKEKLKQFNEYQELDKKDKKNYEKVDIPISGQFIVGDITFEKLISMHERNKKGIGILRDELTGWIKDLNKYRPGSDLESYLSAFSGKPIIKNRVTAEDNYVSQSFVSILGGVQPSILSMHYTNENKDNGLIDRILLCYPKIIIDYFNDNEINEDWSNWYDDEILLLKENIDKTAKYSDTGNPSPNIVTFSQESKKELKRILNWITDIENGESESEYIKNILPKQKTYLSRFALIINTLNWHFNGEKLTEISVKSILSAEKLVKYFIFMAKKNKFETVENAEVKEIVKRTGKAKLKDKFISAITEDPEINITKLSEQLGISRMTAHRWLSDIKKP